MNGKTEQLSVTKPKYKKNVNIVLHSTQRELGVKNNNKTVLIMSISEYLLNPKLWFNNIGELWRGKVGICLGMCVEGIV